MKKLKQKFVVITLIALFTAIHGDSPSLKISFSYPLEWRVYAEELQELGLSKESAEATAKASFNIKN